MKKILTNTKFRTNFGIALFIVSIILGFYFENPWFLLGPLFGMAIVSSACQKEIKEKWNNGICKKHNIPWEFIEYWDLSDGDSGYTFGCKGESISMFRPMMHKVMGQYKGIGKLKGL